MTCFFTIFLLNFFLSFLCVLSAPVDTKLTEPGFELSGALLSRQVLLGGDDVLEDTRLSKQLSAMATQAPMIMTTTFSHQLPTQFPQVQNRRDHAPDSYSIPHTIKHVPHQSDHAAETSVVASDSGLATRIQTDSPQGIEISGVQFSGGIDVDYIASASEEAPITVATQTEALNASGAPPSSSSWGAESGTSGSESESTTVSIGSCSSLTTANDCIDTLTSTVELLKAFHALSFVAHIAHAILALISHIPRIRKAFGGDEPENKSKIASDTKPSQRKEKAAELAA